VSFSILEPALNPFCRATNDLYVGVARGEEGQPTQETEWGGTRGEGGGRGRAGGGRGRRAGGGTGFVFVEHCLSTSSQQVSYDVAFGTNIATR
jgi:hypothetical protein